MARRTEKKGRRRSKAPAPESRTGEPGPLGLTRAGLGLGAAGVLVAILGFWLIAQGSITAAPLLLVLAYLVLIPLALIR
ncbi:MAG: hypothetical protein EA351_02305 [Gemmatimonadales bacterium]|nr:MAG: hypothetical protein EA351_02305 [Gemmatimonadales bacterium]